MSRIKHILPGMRGAAAAVALIALLAVGIYEPHAHASGSGGAFPLPASTTRAGIVKCGTGTSCATDGTLNVTVTGAGGGSGITALTGDVSATGPGSAAATVAQINGAPLGVTTATAGNLLIGSGSAWSTHPISGDCGLASGGVITCSKTSGVSFAPSATTDTTNAANITSGSIAVARFNGGTGASSSTFWRGDGTWGTPSAGSSGITALTGDVSATGPGSAAAVVSAINGQPFGTSTPTAGNIFIGGGSSWISRAITGDCSFSSTGVITCTKTNGTGFAASATVDTTNASNITSGTLPAARLPSTAVTPGTYTNTNLTVGADGRVTAASNGSAGGSVSVTAATPNVVISPNPGTGTFSVGLTEPINNQGTALSYTVSVSDLGKNVLHTAASSVAESLPQAGAAGFASGVSYTEFNRGSGTVTVTPASSTINGASNLALAQNQWAYIFSDGTNWNALVASAAGAGAVSVTPGSPNIVITPNPGTSTFTVGAQMALNYVTTTPYTVLSTDMAKILDHNSGSAVADSLPAPTTTGFGVGAGYMEYNQGAGALTVTPASSTVNGAASLTLSQNQTALLFTTSTGTYGAMIGLAEPNAAYTDQVQAFTKAQRGQQVTPSLVTATFTADFSAGQDFDFALVHASCPCTIANPTNIVGGQHGVIEIDQSATGSDTVTWGSNFKFAGATAPTLSTAANAPDYFGYYVKDSTHIIVGTGALNAH